MKILNLNDIGYVYKIEAAGLLKNNMITIIFTIENFKTYAAIFYNKKNKILYNYIEKDFFITGSLNHVIMDINSECFYLYFDVNIFKWENFMSKIHDHYNKNKEKYERIYGGNEYS